MAKHKKNNIFEYNGDDINQKITVQIDKLGRICDVQPRVVYVGHDFHKLDLLSMFRGRNYENPIEAIVNRIKY